MVERGDCARFISYCVVLIVDGGGGQGEASNGSSPLMVGDGIVFSAGIPFTDPVCS